MEKKEENKEKEEEKERKKKEKFEKLKELKRKRKEKAKKDKEKLKKFNEKKKKIREQRRNLEKIIRLHEEEADEIKNEGGIDASAASTPNEERVLRFNSIDEMKKKQENEEKKQMYHWKKNCDIKKIAEFLEKKRDEKVEEEENDEKKQKIIERYNKRYKRIIKKDLDRIKKIHRGNFKKELKAQSTQLKPGKI